MKLNTDKMNKIGKFGENVACMFLEKHGYEVIERNYLKKWGELDIVAKKDGKLLFAEVKTLKDVKHGTAQGSKAGFRPEENMSKHKQKKFTRVIQTYLEESNQDGAEWSAALLAIRVDTQKKLAKVRFIDNLVLS